MLIGVKTESGSVYVLDLANGTWERRRKTAESGPTRSESGKILKILDLEIGRPMRLLVEPHETTPEGMMRFIDTSVVSHIVSQCVSCGDESCNLD